MPGNSFSALRRRCACFSNLQLAEKYLERAKHLISTQKRDDAEAALVPLEAALEMNPEWEKALELKARALLYLKRYKEVVEMLQEFVPSLMSHAIPSESPVSKDKMKLLSGYVLPGGERLGNFSRNHAFSGAKLNQRLSPRANKNFFERQQWKYLVLGQACCHLGLMEDAMVLLQSGKRTASVMSRRRSNCMRDDNFCSESIPAAESDLVNNMLANIKFLLRRRAAAMAALEAGLHGESVRHFSKIIEGKKGTPQGFIADCYLHRAIAHQAMGKVVDAIADCNKNLSLNPNCTKALSVRASLYQMVSCFSECLLDLQQLKMIYEAALRYQMLPEPRWTMRQQNISDIDLPGGLEHVNTKIASARRKLASGCHLDAHTILDMPYDCKMEDVEKAYLLISLKHRPDKASQFLDRCNFVDGRDIDTVKEEARASAARLSNLIHKAYTQLLSSIVDLEAEKKSNRKNNKSRVMVKRTISKNGGERCLSTIEEESKAYEGEADSPAKMPDPAENQQNCSFTKEIDVKGCGKSQLDESSEYPSLGFPIDKEGMVMTLDEGHISKLDCKGLSDEKVEMEAFTVSNNHGRNIDTATAEDTFSVLATEGDASSVKLMLMMGNRGLSSSALVNALSQALCHDNLLISRQASTWTHGHDWNLPHPQPLPVT